MLIGIGLVLLLGQAPTSPPTIETGSEVRFVSLDLLTVFATGRVAHGLLKIVGALEPGQHLRLLIFPANANDEERGQTVSLVSAFTGVVSSNGENILIFFPDDQEPTLFREWLQRKYGLGMTIQNKESR
jgi:hypothetical protein